MDARYRSYLSCGPNKDWFSSFEKLDGCFVIMGDDRSCNMEGLGTVYVTVPKFFFSI